MPLLILVVLKLTHLSAILPQATEVLLIVFLACTSSTASTVVQLSQNAGHDAAKASSSNIISVLFLIITIALDFYKFKSEFINTSSNSGQDLLLATTNLLVRRSLSE